MFITVRRKKFAKIIEDAKTVVSDRLIAEKTAFCENLVHLGSNFGEAMNPGSRKTFQKTSGSF